MTCYTFTSQVSAGLAGPVSLPELTIVIYVTSESQSLLGENTTERDTFTLREIWLFVRDFFTLREMCSS